ncbi:MAG: hypothetical protein NTAFB01_24880 [Nitrospira sp.]
MRLLREDAPDPTTKDGSVTRFALDWTARSIHQNHRISELPALDATECRRPLCDEDAHLVTQFTETQEPLAP